MAVLDPGVDDGHDDVRAARREVPRLGGVDVRVGCADDSPDGLARVVEAPELREARVVRGRL